jgi:6-phosphofructokinase 2
VRELVVDTSGAGLAAAAGVGALVLKPSRRELALVAGRELADDTDVERAARELLASGPTGGVVVSLGAAGALVVTRDGAARVQAPSVNTSSTVGAGDSLVAAMAEALERHVELIQAVRRGVAARTAATLTAGTSLCRRADVERLVEAVTVTSRDRTDGRALAVDA